MKKHILVIFSVLLFFNNSNALNLNLISVFDNKDGFISPAGITSDRDGNVYVADHGRDKIIKISKDLNTITEIATIKDPISLAYHQDKLYIVTETGGGFIFDLILNDFIGSFGRGYGDNEAFKNIIKPSDVTIDISNNIILVVDLSDKYIENWKTRKP